MVIDGKFYILTFGCQMNKNDSERVAGLLKFIGLSKTETSDDADVLLINTCSVRQSAEDRVFGHIKNWQKFRDKKSKLVIGITGCMPGRDKDGKIREKIPGADLFFPMDELSLLPKRLRELNPDLFPGLFENVDDYLTIKPERDQNFSTFITIQTGCDNYCTYCVVPYARGKERNRSLLDIISEIKESVRSGAKEVTLLGQVVNNYIAPDPENFAKDNPYYHELKPCEFKGVKFNKDFAALLWEINNVEALERLHWTAADPQYFNDYLINALTLPKQVNYLHLPVQSGNDVILKKMNRHYTAQYYIDLVKRVRKIKPEIALGTDIIVGFCGETNEQFEDTYKLFEECDFDISFHAMYSERSGTAAAKAFKDDVPKNVKKERWIKLQNLMEKITELKNRKYKGQTLSVLVHKCEEGICSGNSSEMKLVQFLGDADLLGQVVNVEITRTDTWLLRGKHI